MFYGDLPPVGHKLLLSRHVGVEWNAATYHHQYWVDSGTSALALALLDSKMRNPQIKTPQAIIPGYCCPDLVAACVYAGVQPIAIDISTQDPGYNLIQLRAALGEQVVAVIAVNFLGVAEQLEELRELLDLSASQAMLIEDNAQWFPTSSNQLKGVSDYVTFSFGRGKPMSLLGGGLLLCRQVLQESVVRHIKPAANGSTVLPVLKAHAYNFLLNPKGYFFLNRNPLMSLGKTAYHSLDQISAIDSWRRSLFSANYNNYKKRHEREGALQQLLSVYQQKSAHLQQWHWMESSRNSGLLLRYPLLCATEQTKEKLLRRLVAEGLGASPLYPTEITKIEGVDGRVVAPFGLDNARSFARCFLTLPFHELVSESYQRRIVSYLGDV